MAAPPFEKLDYTEKSSEEMLAQSHAFYLDVKGRRTVRDFSDRPVPREIIANALRPAAPTSNPGTS